MSGHFVDFEARWSRRSASSCRAPKRKEFVSRVELDRVDGLQGALLQFSGLQQGDRTSMELAVVDARRSRLWIVVGLVLAGAWLAAYRFIVRPEPG
jgi:hypothetical protein